MRDDYMSATQLHAFLRNAEAPSFSHESQLPLKSFSSEQIAFGKTKWAQYFGDIGEVPELPKGIEEILQASCPFHPNKQVGDTHMLVLIPKTVDEQPFTLHLLEKLIRTPKEKEPLFTTSYSDYVNRELGAKSVQEAYWVLMTKDVIPNSRSKTYEEQVSLIENVSPYKFPNTLEAAASILLHFLQTNEIFYRKNPITYTRCQEKVDKNQWPVIVGGFSHREITICIDDLSCANCGVAAVRKFSGLRQNDLIFGKEEWVEYFGDIGRVPPLPEDIEEILDASSCWHPGKQVRDSHMVVLIPEKVNGKPFTLNLLLQLVQKPKKKQASNFALYAHDIRHEIGERTVKEAYWILITKGVIPNSRSKTYKEQIALVEAKKVYKLPNTLEAATSIFTHYFKTNEMLYGQDPWTYIRCADNVGRHPCPVAVGRFSHQGVDFCIDHPADSRSSIGVSVVRRFIIQDLVHTYYESAAIALLKKEMKIFFLFTQKVKSLDPSMQYLDTTQKMHLLAHEHMKKLSDQLHKKQQEITALEQIVTAQSALLDLTYRLLNIQHRAPESSF